MSPWLVAVGAGAAFALLQYRWRRTHQGPIWVTAAILRWVAATLVVALLLDAPSGPAQLVRSWAALDVSQSMIREDSALWRAALDSVRAAKPESTLWFGDSTRVTTGARPNSVAPIDKKTELRPLADRAVAVGHPVVLVTDGELSDAEAASTLPAGSRVVVLPRTGVSDAAVISAEVPRAIVAGDTVTAQITVGAGSSGAGAGYAAVRVDGRDAGRVTLDALPAFGTRRIEMRFTMSGPPGPAVVQAIVAARGDRVPRNDTLSVVVDRSRSASAVFVSTSPDFDSRAALGLLRGALALPARGFLRVAPGVWRVDGTLAPVAEVEVRAALRDAPIAIIHGDSDAFGAPRSATTAPFALLVPVSDTTAEWYVAGTPTSPLTPAFAGVGWDSLPPLLVGGDAPKGSWTALEASPGRTGAPRAVVVGTDAPRRTVTIVASGFWRWQFRGGSSADAFAAFWGGIFDWLAGERADKRAAIPDAGSFRSGDAIRWRRGGVADSVVQVTLRRRNAPPQSDSLTLRFLGGASVVESPSVEPGIYDVAMRGGAAILAVNASSEWLPRPVKLRSGPLHGGSPIGTPPRLRDRMWIYALIIGVLCAEWLLRRRIGMR
jgi:hypothetical protein